MADTNVNLPYEYIPQTTRGLPLSQARIFVGNVGQDPEVPANQKTLRVRQGDGTVTTVSQPITTSEGGLPTFNNQPVQLIVDGQYSLKINDMDGNQIYFVSDSAQTLPNVNDLPGTSDLITTINQNIVNGVQNAASYIDAGIANAIQLNAIAPNTAPTAYPDRMQVFFTAAATNTGPVTVRIGTLAAVPVVDINGNAIAPGAIGEGLPIRLYYDLAEARFVVERLERNLLLSDAFRVTTNSTVDFTHAGGSLNAGLYEANNATFTGTTTSPNLTGLSTSRSITVRANQRFTLNGAINLQNSFGVGTAGNLFIGGGGTGFSGGSAIDYSPEFAINSYYTYQSNTGSPAGVRRNDFNPSLAPGSPLRLFLERLPYFTDAVGGGRASGGRASVIFPDATTVYGGGSLFIFAREVDFQTGSSIDVSGSFANVPSGGFAGDSYSGGGSVFVFCETVVNNLATINVSGGTDGTTEAGGRGGIVLVTGILSGNIQVGATNASGALPTVSDFPTS